ncbi:unnamed protein product, partial [marine sediment metagenome]
VPSTVTLLLFDCYLLIGIRMKSVSLNSLKIVIGYEANKG